MSVYKIGKRTFACKKLVLGQLAQLEELFKLLAGLEVKDINDMFSLLGKEMPKLIAIILCEDGKRLKDKDVQALQEYLEENLELDVALEILNDFFVQTPLPKLIEKVTTLISGMTQ